ncbi:MAG: hypothetical protein KBC98_00585 [Candidatus Pacebacteria bacterium]|nr:hypothetical protein [Candidatus Paceibacterota bacterium]
MAQERKKLLRGKSEFCRSLQLSEEYTVSGFLCFGGWNTEDQLMNLENTLKNENVSYEIKRMEGFLRGVHELTINNKVYWFSVLYGGAMLSEYTHLACLFGSKKNIHIGSCGGLHPGSHSGDILLSSWSFGNESSTRLYEPDAVDHKHYSDSSLSASLKSRIGPSHKVLVGPIMTCQAMLAETEEDVQEWSQAGYYGVEMETATIFAASNHFQVPSASAVYIGDNIIKGQVVGDTTYLEQKELRESARNELYRVAIQEIITE